MNSWTFFLRLAFLFFSGTLILPSPAKGTFFLKQPKLKYYVHTQEYPQGVPINIARKSDLVIESAETKLITHGYKGNISDLQDIVKEYISLNEYLNVLTVDWSQGSRSRLHLAARYAYSLGSKVVANGISKLHHLYNIPKKRFHLIGFNMGAHLMGAAGRVHTGIGRITGLDPSKIYEHRPLKSTDANFVDVIHTSAGTTGIDRTIGTVDIYPNGGRFQPRCKKANFVRCNTHVALDYYAESIRDKTKFVMISCPNYYNFLRGRCLGNKVDVMGAFCSTSISGTYYLLTDSSRFKINVGRVKILDQDGTFYYHTLNYPNGQILNHDDLGILFKNTKKPPEKIAKLIVLSHGQGSSGKMQLQPIVEEYLRLESAVLISYEWKCSEELNKLQAARLAIEKGKRRVGYFLQRLIGKGYVSPDKIHLIGYGMGAHMMGAAARVQKKKIYRITGLDPFKQYFDHNSTVNLHELNPNDAFVVDVIHTSGGTLGIERRIGTIDIFPNGGKSQPKCQPKDEPECNSLVSIEYFAESIRELTSVSLLMRACSSYGEFMKGYCKRNNIAVMGAHGNVDIRGDYYLRTNSRAPYGMGVRGTNPTDEGDYEPKPRAAIIETPKTKIINTARKSRANDDAHGNFYVHTREFPDGKKLDLQNGGKSPYIVLGADTVVITHGYKEDYKTVLDVAKEFTQVGEMNVITYDWSTYAKYAEDEAARQAVFLGADVVSMKLKILHEEYEVSYDQMYLIGNDMGSHLMGAAARQLPETIQRITALDPHRDYFIDGKNPPLRKTDATFVDVFHTMEVSGYNDSLGTADIFVTEKSDKSDCQSDSEEECAPHNAIYFYKQSISGKNGLWVVDCPNDESFLKGECENNMVAEWGAFGDISLEGRYNLVSEKNVY